MTRIGVFIDYQNAYHCARETFGFEGAADQEGQVSPLRLGHLLAGLRDELDHSRRLVAVNVYRGEPDWRSGGLRAGFDEQVRRWRASSPLVTVKTRPLVYRQIRAWNGSPPDPGEVEPGHTWDKGHEKGIDTMISIDMAIGAERGAFDVAVLFSEDADLAPALDAVEAAGAMAESAHWTSRSRPGRPVRSASRSTWSHALCRHWFDAVADHTDYVALSGAGAERMRPEASEPLPCRLLLPA